MGYNDFGAFVWRNGERAESHEDAVLERLDGGAGGRAVYDHLAEGSDGHLYHAVLGDGDWRVGVYKTSFPYLWHRVDGRWRMADLLAYATAEPGFECERDDGITRPYHWSGWEDDLPSEGLTCVVPDGPAITVGRGRHHARWHGDTIHVTMTEPDGTRWETEAGDRYGAGFEGQKERRAREVRKAVRRLESTWPMRWRRATPCPRCGVRPVVGREETDDSGRKGMSILCPKCGLRLDLLLRAAVDYEPGRHRIDPALAEWTSANLTSVALRMWNRWTNDAKAMRNLPSGGIGEFRMVADGQTVGDLAWWA